MTYHHKPSSKLSCNSESYEITILFRNGRKKLSGQQLNQILFRCLYSLPVHREHRYVKVLFSFSHIYKKKSLKGTSFYLRLRVLM